MTTISSSTTTTTAYTVTADTTGALVLQTGSTPTTAVTISSAQVVTLANALPVASGGTGSTTSTGSGSVVLGTSPSISGAVLSSMASSVITAGTAQTTTSGTSINFTGLPSWVKRITILFQSVSTTGTSNVGIQLGTGGTPTYVTTGYASVGNSLAGGGVASSAYTTLFGLGSGNQAAASVMQGQMIISNITGNNWVFCGTTSQTNTNATHLGNGSISLGAALTAVRITTVAGTDTFDAGTMNIFYE